MTKKIGEWKLVTYSYETEEEKNIHAEKMSVKGYAWEEEYKIGTMFFVEYSKQGGR